MKKLSDLRRELNAQANPERAKSSAWFFKTGQGEYGEGDVFWGITVPVQRKVAKEYPDLSLNDLEKLLQSKVHEERLTAIFILVAQFKKADEAGKKQIYEFYLQHTDCINNWDIVDSSAPYIVGGWLIDKDRSVLTKLAYSKLLWDRRIAMLGCLAFIADGDNDDTFKIATILVSDEHDLIQKAVGWMLREIGKRSGQKVEEKFLRIHYKIMPRTMLRYAIEKFPEAKRQAYLKGTV